MNWEDERYVRLYVRDTITWKLLGWEGRCVLSMLMRKVDRAGCLDLEAGSEGLAALLELPEDVTERGLAACLKRGVFTIKKDLLVVPNFLAAQEAKQNDKQRQRESRERRRDLDKRAGVVTDVSEMSRNVTVTESVETSRNVTKQPHKLSRNVTDSHKNDENVTLSCAQPSLAQDPPKSPRGPDKCPDDDAVKAWFAIQEAAGGHKAMGLDRHMGKTQPLPLDDNRAMNWVKNWIALRALDPPYTLASCKTLGDWIAAGGSEDIPPFRQLAKAGYGAVTDITVMFARAIGWNPASNPRRMQPPARATWSTMPPVPAAPYHRPFESAKEPEPAPMTVEDHQRLRKEAGYVPAS